MIHGIKLKIKKAKDLIRHEKKFDKIKLLKESIRRSKTKIRDIKLQQSKGRHKK